MEFQFRYLKLKKNFGEIYMNYVLLLKVIVFIFYYYD